MEALHRIQDPVGIACGRSAAHVIVVHAWARLVRYLREGVLNFAHELIEAARRYDRPLGLAGPFTSRRPYAMQS
jgi:hypothetical protein